MNERFSDSEAKKVMNNELVFFGLLSRDFSDKALVKTAQSWFLVAVIGQWVFVYYLVVFYLGSAIQGNLEAWNNIAAEAYTPGKFLDNLAFAVHVGLAILIMIAGPLQLIPTVRKIFPTFHRWSGRAYLVAIIFTSLAGLFMVWVKGMERGLLQDLGLSLDAVLIFVFAFFTLRYALAGNIAVHRRWALRLFMAVNAVWFFRVGVMFWVFINQGPVGFDMKTFQGPFLDFLSFAQYLIPLAVLEMYFRAQDSDGIRVRMAMTACLIALTVAMGVGIFAAIMFMWLPNV